MSGTVFIYALKEPDTGEIRYVGKSENPHKRFQSHIYPPKSEKSYRANWVRSLRTRGLKPELEILDEVSEVFWQQWEAAWIEFFMESGCNLVNGTWGGEGAGSGRDHPLFGKCHTADTRQKISNANTGKRHSIEVRKAMGASRLGEKNGFFGRKHSVDTRQRIRLAVSGEKSPAFGKVVSAHTRKKSSESNTRKTSNFLGVGRRNGYNIWRANIRVGGKQFFLGNYRSEEDAAHAYDWVARLYFGDFAKVNFP